jgi:hypothetical protein
MTLHRDSSTQTFKCPCDIYEHHHYSEILKHIHDHHTGRQTHGGKEPSSTPDKRKARRMTPYDVSKAKEHQVSATEETQCSEVRSECFLANYQWIENH